MARLALFLISISCLMLAGCNDLSVVKDLSKVSVDTKRGITTVDGKIFTGTLISFFENSTDTMEVCSYKNGKKSGVHSRWFNRNQKKYEYHFDDNEFNGMCRDWSASGLMIRQMNYVDGHENGLQQLWDEDGTIRMNYVARNGRNYGLTGVKSCVSQIH